MSSFTATTTIASDGGLTVGSVPFAPGTEVEVFIAPRRSSAQEFEAGWRKICGAMRASTGHLSDDEIAAEIVLHRKAE